MKYHFLPNFSNRSSEGLVTLPCRGRAVAAYMASSYVGLRVSLGMALVALIIVALAENGRIPVDNPATHLELTMVHEVMILEYSGRHLAVIELAAMLKLVLYVSLIMCVFAPWGLAIADASVADRLIGAFAYLAKLAVRGRAQSISGGRY